MISGTRDCNTDHDNNEEHNNIEKTDKPQVPHDISSSNYLLILMQFLGRSLKFSVLVEAYESITAISKLINLKFLNKTDVYLGSFY